MKQNVSQTNDGITINVNLNVKKVIYVKNIMFGSGIVCAEVIYSFDEERSFNDKKATCKTQKFYILIAFLLITIALLIAVSIYFYLINYQAKHLLPFHKKLKTNLY